MKIQICLLIALAFVAVNGMGYGRKQSSGFGQQQQSSGYGQQRSSGNRQQGSSGYGQQQSSGYGQQQRSSGYGQQQQKQSSGGYGDESGNVDYKLKYEINLPEDEHMSRADWMVEQDKQNVHYTLDQTHPYGAKNLYINCFGNRRSPWNGLWKKAKAIEWLRAAKIVWKRTARNRTGYGQQQSSGYGQQQSSGYGQQQMSSGYGQQKKSSGGYGDESGNVDYKLKYEIHLPEDEHKSRADWMVEQDKQNVHYTLDQTHPYEAKRSVITNATISGTTEQLQETLDKIRAEALQQGLAPTFNESTMPVVDFNIEAENFKPDLSLPVAWIISIVVNAILAICVIIAIIYWWKKHRLPSENEEAADVKTASNDIYSIHSYDGDDNRDSSSRRSSSRYSKDGMDGIFLPPTTNNSDDNGRRGNSRNSYRSNSPHSRADSNHSGRYSGRNSLRSSLSTSKPNTDLRSSGAWESYDFDRRSSRDRRPSLPDIPQGSFGAHISYDEKEDDEHNREKYLVYEISGPTDESKNRDYISYLRLPMENPPTLQKTRGYLKRSPTNSLQQISNLDYIFVGEGGKQIAKPLEDSSKVSDMFPNREIDIQVVNSKHLDCVMPTNCLQQISKQDYIFVKEDGMQILKPLEDSYKVSDMFPNREIDIQVVNSKHDEKEEDEHTREKYLVYEISGPTDESKNKDYLSYLMLPMENPPTLQKTRGYLERSPTNSLQQISKQDYIFVREGWDADCKATGRQL
ncbi:hypothetical protein GQR58_018963 [Nymphon striatum]|nr:hypothetical protein GQR58_018963 [Nymphon striatum]